MNTAKEKVAVDLRHGLWTLLLRTRKIMYKAREKEHHQHGISLGSSGVLLTILRLGEKATPSAISRDLFLEPHSVSELLKRMEKEGLIKRTKDSKRRNLVHVELTEKGYDAHLESSERESTNAIMSVLTYEEQLELWCLLAKLRASAIEYLGMEDRDLYPPSDPEDL